MNNYEVTKGTASEPQMPRATEKKISVLGPNKEEQVILL